ncbi:BTAD domain-containing putative transcriptional regulator [Kitasatospora sp. NPDC056181]|uniref:AfsR/SARP family transcriptional regulator n=1 Tax=Kitasatospora sp. NPDC056181 TaxID=3345737 RepID=UPI0035DF9982
MGIRLLGPVELRLTDGEAAGVGGAQRRAVLALLALELGRAVPVERFFELLWADAPPTRARAALQGHVAALRKVLAGSGFTLLTRSPGYQLTGEPGAVDALAAGALAARAATTADDAAAAALLQQALRLWRGAALADLPATPLCAALADRLDDTRTETLTAWAGRQLRLGQGHTAVPALEQSVRADGLREPTTALLMRCLHQGGRGPDALRVYHRARVRLDEELGVTPGPALQAALTAVLTADRVADRVAEQSPTDRPTAQGSGPATGAPGMPAVPMPVPVPAAVPVAGQLPSPPRGFVGRATEDGWLDQQCGPDRSGDGLAVVAGPAGVGKTALVVRWAHRAAAGFPDGRLFADLRGFDPAGPGDPGQVLGGFLRALGVPETAIPEERDARAALFREQTGRRRLLVVLDNARCVADVAGLLPSGPGCATVVTSRNSLEDLVVTDGAALLQLDALPAGDARRLLERQLTAERVGAEPDAAGRLVGLCDRLPLALRIVAARLAARPGWRVADLVEELSDERTRLASLGTPGGVTSVRTALSLTYPHLPDGARSLLALLTVHPGAEADPYAAAALLGTDAAAARQALGPLTAHHLLTEPSPGRFGRHDLVRLYGAELFERLPEERRRQAFRNLADYELVAAGLAVQRMNPFHEPFRPAGPGPLALPRLADAPSTLAWCHAEEPVLRALVTAATDRGEHERAWRLARVTATLYYGAGRVSDRLGCLRIGLRAARLDGGREGLAAMEAATACALGSAGHVAEALPLAAQAVARTTPDDGDLHIHALSVRASMAALSGDPAGADRLSQAALDLIRASGLREHAATVLSNAAAVKVVLGDSAAALDHARETRALLADNPTANAHLWAMVSEALALQALGERTAAERVWREALRLCRSTGNVRLHALTRRHFAGFLAGTGRADEAREHLRVAGELYTAHGDARPAEELDRLLAPPPGAAADDPRGRRRMRIA